MDDEHADRTVRRDEALAAALEAAFPDRTVAAVDDTGPSWNEANRTAAVRFGDGGRAFLKLATDGESARVVRERAAIGHVRVNREVGAPEVLASDPDHDSPYLATAPIAGQPLHRLWADADEDGRDRLARAVGRALAALHAERFPEHGRIRGGGSEGLDLDAAPWPDVLAATVAEMRALAVSERYDGLYDDVLAAVEANRDLLSGAPAALLHGDPAKPNAFRAGSRVGFVDWERAHVGDPARELVRVREQQLDPLRGSAPERLVAALHAGYREHAGGLPEGFAQRRPVYEAVRLLGVAGFFEHHVAFLDADPEELGTWLEDEMARRLDAVS
ncbi:MAG: phosphotransferase [Halobacteriales archaeon]